MRYLDTLTKLVMVSLCVELQTTKTFQMEEIFSWNKMMNC